MRLGDFFFLSVEVESPIWMVPALLESGEVLRVGMYMKGRSHVVSQGAREQKRVHLALLSHPSHENQIEFPENYPNISSKPRTPPLGPTFYKRPPALPMLCCGPLRQGIAIL